MKFYYGGDTACGCNGTSKATCMTTSGGLYTTEVSREYDPRGLLTAESITVGTGCAPSLTTTTDYNESGWRTTLQMADICDGTLVYNGTEIRNNYKSDGRVESVELLVDDDPETWEAVLEYEYRGDQVHRTVHRDRDGDLIAVGTQTFDSRNYPCETEWADNFPASSPTLIARQTMLRDGQGYLTSMSHTTSAASGDDWINIGYEGPHWIKEFTWFETSSTLGSTGRKRTFTRNEFGERSLATETGLPDQGGTNDWAFPRDSAGFFVGATGGSTDRVFKYDEYGGLTQTLYAHVMAWDAMGQRYSAGFTFEDLAETCTDSIVAWDYEYDAWGRVTKALRNRVCTGTGAYDVDAQFDYVYDALGRLVYQETSGDDDTVDNKEEYFAYEGNTLRTTLELDGSCDVDGLTEKFGGRGGGGIPEFPEKEMQRPGAGGGGGGGGPGPAESPNPYCYVVSPCGILGVATDEAATSFALVTELPSGEAVPLGTNYTPDGETWDTSDDYVSGFVTYGNSLAPNSGPTETDLKGFDEPEVDAGQWGGGTNVFYTSGSDGPCVCPDPVDVIDGITRLLLESLQGMTAKSGKEHGAAIHRGKGGYVERGEVADGKKGQINGKSAHGIELGQFDKDKPMDGIIHSHPGKGGLTIAGESGDGDIGPGFLSGDYGNSIYAINNRGCITAAYIMKNCVDESGTPLHKKCAEDWAKNPQGVEKSIAAQMSRIAREEGMDSLGKKMKEKCGVCVYSQCPSREERQKGEMPEAKGHGTK